MKKTPTLEQFAHLREHLSSLNPMFERFCREYGYEERTTALGRYPRRRVCRYGEINLYLDLQMDLDEEGEFYQDFNSQLPYTMDAGAWLDINRMRYGTGFLCFQKLPFSEVEKLLWNYLLDGHSKMSGWTKDYLLKEGEKSPIASSE